MTEMQDGVGACHRTLWRLLETYHALVYYAPERRERYARLGVTNGWMAYFATRSAALGVAPSKLITACFYGFADTLVADALPAAWRYTSPELALDARYDVFDRASSRLLGGNAQTRTVADVADRLCAVVNGLPPHGRPMFAAHAAAQCPEEPHTRLFWAATALREYRGDAHIAALQAELVSPAESNFLMTAMRLTPANQRSNRGWTTNQWDDARASLTARGWIDADGTVTREGRSRRAEIERVTDLLVASAWAGIDQRVLVNLMDVLGALVGAFVTAGEVPYPNAIGVPAVAELGVPR